MTNPLHPTILAHTLASPTFDTWLASLDDDALRIVALYLETATNKAESLRFARYLAHSGSRTRQALAEGGAL
jgi:hypothetical protein